MRATEIHTHTQVHNVYIQFYTSIVHSTNWPYNLTLIVHDLQCALCIQYHIGSTCERMTLYLLWIYLETKQRAKCKKNTHKQIVCIPNFFWNVSFIIWCTFDSCSFIGLIKFGIFSWIWICYWAVDVVVHCFMPVLSLLFSSRSRSRSQFSRPIEWPSIVLLLCIKSVARSTGVTNRLIQLFTFFS